MNDLTSQRKDKLVRCSKCGEFFSFSEIEIQEKKAKDEELSVMYYMCPKCGEMFVIMLKDQLIEGLLDDMASIQDKLALCRCKEDSSELKDKLIDLFRKKQDRLARHSEKLRSKYEGKLTVRTSEETTDILYLPRSNN